MQYGAVGGTIWMGVKNDSQDSVQPRAVVSAPCDSGLGAVSRV